jgi:hypothetical protein
MVTVKIKYLERRVLKDCTVGWVWNNRHARKAGMDISCRCGQAVASRPHRRALYTNYAFPKVGARSLAPGPGYRPCTGICARLRAKMCCDLSARSINAPPMVAASPNSRLQSVQRSAATPGRVRGCAHLLHLFDCTLNEDKHYRNHKKIRQPSAWPVP